MVSLIFRLDKRLYIVIIYGNSWCIHHWLCYIDIWKVRWIPRNNSTIYIAMSAPQWGCNTIKHHLSYAVLTEITLLYVIYSLIIICTVRLCVMLWLADGNFTHTPLFFIRPFEKRTYYAVALSVRLSVRPSAFSGLFFNMLWDINLKLGTYIQ